MTGAERPPDLAAETLAVVLLESPSADHVRVREIVASFGCSLSVLPVAATRTTPLTTARVDAVILDLAIGQEALRFLRRHATETDAAPVVCLADRRRRDTAAEALRLGAIDVVGRPIAAASLRAALGNARLLAVTAQVDAEDTAVEPVRHDALFGPSAAMRSMLTLVGRVAPSQCSLLIVGELGSGRETIARAIHDASPHAAAPFLAFPSSVITIEDLRQAFEGSAPHATLFLSDLGGLPEELQSALEARLAPDEAPAASVRVLAGARPKVMALVKRGVLRRSLVERLATVRIDVAPLRQRPEDIPSLAMHFLKAACVRDGAQPKTFTRAARTLLAALPWRGNADELRLLCDRLAAAVPRGLVLLEDVVAHVRLDAAEAAVHPRESLRVARERFERDYIAEMLRHHKGRMGAAAQELGIERTNLYRKIRQLNVQWIEDSEE